MHPTPAQAEVMEMHCSHARYVWNLAVEQMSYRHHRQRMPNSSERSRQLTEARQEFDWLAAGPRVIQEQALRDFDQALDLWWRGTHRRPTWRKQGRNEGFRVHDGRDINLQCLNHKWSRAHIPKVGWVKFRRTRALGSVKSFRVTLDSAGRWHIAFPVIPEVTTGPCDGLVVGLDLGVVVTLALSDGAMYQAPTPLPIKQAAQALSRCKRGSHRRKVAKARLAKVHAHNADRRRDWAEKASTDIARNYDLIRIEDLKVVNMTRSASGTVEMPGRNVRQKAGLNQSILNAGWGMFVRRLQDKAPGRVEKVSPAYTSQRCSVCQHVARESRKSQALFQCVSCGHTSNADLNAARNIAAGQAVRGAEIVSALRRVPQRTGPRAT